ncbi:MAG: gluconate 2-dehydrogenase subunit 3 family protein [Haloarculaceae archaeon]
MELTRRDALAALAGAGILGGGGAAALVRDGFAGHESGGPDGRRDEPSDGERPLTADDREAVLETLVGTARVVYPTPVENVREFVTTYAATKLDRRPDYARGAAAVLDDLDAQARISFDARYRDLSAGEREAVLRRVGAETAEPDPDGTTAEQVRYYLVNEVLYALYTSPTGGRLVGIENPQGYPGGTASYQRGPVDAGDGSDAGARSDG